MEALRKLAASYLRSHQDDFAPFFLTDAGELMTEAQFEKHCADIEGTATWGGQAELRALSHALKRQIVVYQAVGAPIVGGYNYLPST